MTQDINQGDWCFIRKLRTIPFCATVHSIFTKSFNVKECSTGTLFTFTANQSWVGPDTLNIAIAHVHELNLDRGSKIYWKEPFFYIRDTPLFYLDPKIQGTDLSVPEYTGHNITAKIKLLEHFVTQDKELKNKDMPESDLFFKEFQRLFDETSQGLCAALLKEDMALALSKGIHCLGLGPGLTPSGDDFLVGFFSVLHMDKNPINHCKVICIPIANEARKKTTDISAAILSNAAKGRFLTLITDVLASLSKDDKTTVTAVEKLLSLGSSSGADICGGILAALRLNVSLSTTS